MADDLSTTDPAVLVTLARMEGKLDGALATLGGHTVALSELDKAVHAHDTDLAVLKAASLPSRVTSLERKVWMAAGAAAALGGGLGTLASRLLS